MGVIVQCFCKIRLPAPRLSPIVDFESNYFQKVETLKLQKQNSVYQRTKTDWKGVRRSGNNLSDISCSSDILVQLWWVVMTGMFCNTVVILSRPNCTYTNWYGSIISCLHVPQFFSPSVVWETWRLYDTITSICVNRVCILGITICKTHKLICNSKRKYCTRDYIFFIIENVL